MNQFIKYLIGAFILVGLWALSLPLGFVRFSPNLFRDSMAYAFFAFTCAGILFTLLKIRQ
jgi:hypothetical protein